MRCCGYASLVASILVCLVCSRTAARQLFQNALPGATTGPAGNLSYPTLTDAIVAANTTGAGKHFSMIIADYVLI